MYKNDLEAVQAFMNDVAVNGVQMPNKEQARKLASIAADCMEAYEPKAGDAQLVGFGIYSGYYQAQGSEIRYSDGATLFSPDEKRAVILISADVLTMGLPEYARVGVGLHELAHLGGMEHNDRFVSRLLELQLTYYARHKHTSL